MIALALMAAAAVAQAAPVEVTAPGPQGVLAGTMLDPGGDAPMVLIVPGSGPTDRDGNSPLGVRGGPYRQLAEGLAARGVASVRIDKRGMFGSKEAIPDANKVTIADYAADLHSWIDEMRHRTGRRCLWVLGHSEGGLVALAAAQQPDGICGLVLIAAPGRPFDVLLREQLHANPANAPLLPAADAAIATVKTGGALDPATLPAPLKPLFGAPVQAYLHDLFSYDPTALIARTRLPVLLVQGDRDIQVSVADAQALHAADPTALLDVLKGVNHILKYVASDDRAANVATYADAALPIAPEVPAVVARFVRSGGAPPAPRRAPARAGARRARSRAARPGSAPGHRPG